MASSTLQKLYTKKKRLLDDAETKVRFALAQTKQEAKLETALYYTVHKLAGLTDEVGKKIDTIHLLRDKPRSREHFQKKLAEHLGKMRTSQKEAQELLNTLKSVKNNGRKNIHALNKDFKRIGVLRKKIDRYVDV